jgi:hypothetical protein
VARDATKLGRREAAVNRRVARGTIASTNAMLRTLRHLVSAAALASLGCSNAAPVPALSDAPPGDEQHAMHEAPSSCTASDGRITITARMDPEVHVERVPMRRVRMSVRNVSRDPIRVLHIHTEPFRHGFSTLTITVPDGAPVFAPEPRPHGYLIGEQDFVLIEPGTVLDFDQSFTIDPMQPGAGTRTARRPGFVAGATAKISWTFANQLRAFPGGAQTMDGVTKPLFGGGDVPLLWLGELSCSFAWTVQA